MTPGSAAYGVFWTMGRLLSLFVFLQAFAFAQSDYTGPYSYGVFIDAGSQGSRLYVYRWPERDFDVFPPPGTAQLEEVGSEKSLNRKTPGIATLKAVEVHDYLQPLEQQAALLLESEGLDTDDLALVPFYIFSTAGMRVLPETEQSSLLDAMRTFVEGCEFLYKQDNVRIISGEEEGAFGWLTVNYLMDKFHGIQTQQTYGALDLGGASTQITFQPPTSQPILQGFFPLRLAQDLRAGLYTHSYLFLGLNEARLQYHQRLFAAEEKLRSDGMPLLHDPCMPVDSDGQVIVEMLIDMQGNSVAVQIIGTSNATGCQATVESLLRSLKPGADQCFHHDHTDCSLLGVYQPPISGDAATVMYAFSGFVYSWQFFGMDTAAQQDLQTLSDTASTVCQKDLVDLKAYNANLTNPQKEDFLNTYCFSGNYIIALLDIGYGMSRVGTPLRVADKVNGSTVTYAFGAMLYEVNQLKWTHSEKSRTNKTEIVCWILLSTVGCILGGICLYLAVALRKERQRGYVSANSSYADRLLISRT